MNNKSPWQIRYERENNVKSRCENGYIKDEYVEYLESEFLEFVHKADKFAKRIAKIIEISELLKEG